MLAEHGKSFQKLGYLFGRNMALAWQVCRDQKIFETTKNEEFSLVCAPLLFHIQSDPSYYENLMENVKNDNVDYAEIKKVVRSGPGLKKSADLQEEFSLNALKALEEFPDTEAKSALANIIHSL